MSGFLATEARHWYRMWNLTPGPLRLLLVVLALAVVYVVMGWL